MTEENTPKGSDEIEELGDHTHGDKRYKPYVCKDKKMSQAARHAAIIDLTHRGNAPSMVAAALSMPVGTVKSIIKRFKPIFKELEAVEDYRSVKADLLSAAQLSALKSAMSPSKLRKSSFLATIQGFKILNNAERLENDQSTANVSMRIGRAKVVDDD